MGLSFVNESSNMTAIILSPHQNLVLMKIMVVFIWLQGSPQQFMSDKMY